jgi:hypothetical protein
MSIRLLVLCLSVVAIMASACGGTAQNPAEPAAASPSASIAAEADAVGALVASAMHLAGDARGAEATFRWTIDRDGFHLKGDGTYLVTASGDLQIESHYRGEGSKPSSFKEANDSQVVMLADKAYVLSPSLGSTWVMFTPQEFAADWNVVQRLASARSPLDYSTIVRATKSSVAAAGSDPIEGHLCDRYSGMVDANSLMEALADAYGSQGQVMLVNRFSGAVKTDIWVDPLTALPCRLVADGHVSYLNGDTHITIAVDYTDFDPVADITAPTHFVTFQDLASAH